MTAAFDDFEDPEEAAESVAGAAYGRVLLLKGALLLLAFTGCLAALAGDYVFGVLALRLVPQRAFGFLASFMAVELYLIASGQARARRERRGQDAGLPEGERHLAALDRMRAPVPPPWWRAGPRSWRLWAGLLIRGLYSGCAALVLVSAFGPLAGGLGAAAFTVAAIAARAGVTRQFKAAVDAMAFTDPRPPRDTPEA